MLESIFVLPIRIMSLDGRGKGGYIYMMEAMVKS
jgi:hypothetical protein